MARGLGSQEQIKVEQVRTGQVQSLRLFLQEPRKCDLDVIQIIEADTNTLR